MDTDAVRYVPWCPTKVLPYLRYVWYLPRYRRHADIFVPMAGNEWVQVPTRGVSTWTRLEGLEFWRIFIPFFPYIRMYVGRYHLALGAGFELLDS